MQVNDLAFFYGAIFIAALLFVEGAYYFVRSRTRGDLAVNRRLRVQFRTEDGREALAQLRKETRSFAGPLGYFNRLLSQSGSMASVNRLFLTMLAVASGVLVLLLAKSPLSLLPNLAISAALGAALPILYYRQKVKKRALRFNEQLPDALDTMARSLQAGHPFSSALSLAAEDLGDPMGTELGIVVDEMTYGLDLETALDNMRNRVKLPDLDYMVVAISIQHETGGNLAEVLSNLSQVIRDRFRMFLKIRAISAEGRLSAWVISLLPFFVAFIINMINPSYFGKYIDDPTFQYLMLAGLAGIGLGAFTMFKMVNFRV
ncbi:MAG TPA: type II secretion system F family protein [Woeseiaceae bacterium]|jgi:tight adherence protein B|nr:type II secretion system F family protein [Woeseiaceae bacterium]